MEPGSSLSDSFPVSSVSPAPEPWNLHLLGEEDTPALVQKTFPVDSVGAVVTGNLAGTAVSPPPAALALPSAGAELEIKFSGPLPAAGGSRLRGTPGPREGDGPGRRPSARGSVVDKVWSAPGTPYPQPKHRRAQAWERGASSSRFQDSPVRLFPVKTVLARIPWRKNEIKPPVHRARQRDLPCGDLLALILIQSYSGYPKSPRREGSLLQGQLSTS